MIFFILCILLTASLPVATVILFVKKWRKVTDKLRRIDIEMGGLFVVLASIVATAVFWVFFGDLCKRTFDFGHPVCLEYIGSAPIESHWAKPENKFVTIPDGFPSYYLKDMSSLKCLREDYFIKDGRRIEVYSRSSDYVLFQKEKTPLDSLRFYVYNYKTWGPFSAPGFTRQGHACVGEPDLIKRGRCKTEVKLE